LDWRKKSLSFKRANEVRDRVGWSEVVYDHLGSKHKETSDAGAPLREKLWEGETAENSTVKTCQRIGSGRLRLKGGNVLPV